MSVCCLCLLYVGFFFFIPKSVIQTGMPRKPQHHFIVRVEECW